MPVNPKDEVNAILGEAIPQLMNTMASMAQGCSGGPNGVPPLNWGGRQQPGNAAVQTLGDARVALQAADPSDVNKMEQIKTQINSSLNQWDTLIASLNDSCSGGPHGEDPVNYGNYILFADRLKERLRTAMRFL